MTSESVTISPEWPSSFRSTPSIAADDSEAGIPPVKPGTLRCPTITAASVAPTTAAKGIRSRWRSSSRGAVDANWSWVSAVAAPWPGKCFTTGTTPPALRPSTVAMPYSVTVAGSLPNERSPMPSPAPTSMTGAKFMVKPSWYILRA